MPCFNPLRAWYTDNINPETNKREITFQRSNARLDLELALPCGQCMGCRVKYSMQWALRSIHEAAQYNENCFITLTYNDENLPSDGSLNKKHFVDFMKRLRKKFQPKKIRYLMCGEYGDQLGRPHFHALLFNHDFADKEELQFKAKSILYTSKTLEDIWGFGHVTIGALTYESAAYTARYATKKITGDGASEHYDGRTPEYSTVSRRPGLGTAYFERYCKEMYQAGFIVHNGRKFPLPRFYREKFTEEEQSNLKERINREMELDAENYTLERLRVREKVAEQRLNKLTRD